MENTVPRIDAYIERSADFAKPILNHIRQMVHEVCPDVQETIKWGFPHFEYKGVICNMASFKNHCAFGFWKASLMKDTHKLFSISGENAMGHFGRITSLNDLPSDEILKSYILEAVNLNKEGIKIPGKSKPKDKKELQTPEYFLEALSKTAIALSTFENFSYSNKKEYIEWIEDAKTESTRNKRLETAVEWIAEGKVRNWKYVK